MIFKENSPINKANQNILLFHRRGFITYLKPLSYVGDLYLFDEVVVAPVLLTILFFYIGYIQKCLEFGNFHFEVDSALAN